MISLMLKPFKYLVMFCIFFGIMSITIMDKPLFNHIHGYTAKYVKRFSFKRDVVDNIAIIKDKVISGHIPEKIPKKVMEDEQPFDALNDKNDKGDVADRYENSEKDKLINILK